jgi:hypothetical protein
MNAFDPYVSTLVKYFASASAPAPCTTHSVEVERVRIVCTRIPKRAARVIRRVDTTIIYKTIRRLVDYGFQRSGGRFKYMNPSFLPSCHVFFKPKRTGFLLCSSSMESSEVEAETGRILVKRRILLDPATKGSNQGEHPRCGSVEIETNEKSQRYTTSWEY